MHPKSPWVVSNEIALYASGGARAVLVLEGADDIRYWRPRTTFVRFVDSGGKQNAIAGICGATHRGFGDKALAIVDDDMDSLFDETVHAKNIIYTHVTDIETLLLLSSALDHVLSEFGDARSVDGFGGPREVRRHLFALGRDLGRLRYLSRRHDWRVDFKRLGPHSIVSPEEWKLDCVRAKRLIVDQTPGLSVGAIDAALATTLKLATVNVCNGHDLLAILAVGLQRKLSDVNVSTDRIASILRSAHSLEDLRRTSLFRSIREWELHSGTSVLTVGD